jgi:N-acyl-D-amino-acid deacylase
MMVDVLIKNALIVDGTGRRRYHADLGLTGKRITALGKNLKLTAPTVIDAQNQVVAPGFIDIHSHSDLSPFFTNYKMQSKLYQGITLEIIGNCGISCLPVNDAFRQAITEFIGAGLELPLNGMVMEDDSVTDYAEHLKRCPAATNVGVLIGHGTLRGCIMGFEMRPPSSQELKDMEALLDKELTAGAFGMSLGLIYPPSSYGEMEELIALAKVLKKHNAILTVHMRSESTKIFEALQEMLAVTRASGVHLEISHLKLIGKPQWGRAQELLDLIKSGQAEGLDITCDQYPYTATSTNMSAMVPGWAQSGGAEAMCERLKTPTPQLLQEIREEMERRGGAKCVLVVSTHDKYPEFEGQTLDLIAAKLMVEPEAAVAQLLVATNGGVPCCYFSLSEDDVLTIMREPYICVGSDGYAMPFEKGLIGTNPHPRSFGTFPRYLQTIREQQLMSLEEAIAKITSLPARILGLRDRGRIALGQYADLTIFDPAQIADCSKYTDSLRKPAGIKYVIIDGRIALAEGEQVGGNFGQVLLHA